MASCPQAPQNKENRIEGRKKLQTRVISPLFPHLLWWDCIKNIDFSLIGKSQLLGVSWISNGHRVIIIFFPFNLYFLLSRILMHLMVMLQVLLVMVSFLL
jgi:hypothetical protein